MTPPGAAGVDDDDLVESDLVSRRRPALAPWKTAGKVTEEQHSADDVVRETGWVFNNETGEQLTLEEFVETGRQEVGYYGVNLDLKWPGGPDVTLVEIGCGIGRMTAPLTVQYGCVMACDLDQAFLERCRETVARLGNVAALQTVPVDDGRTLRIPDASADVVFSYITLQHCREEDALALVREALRVAKPGARIALNFRTWTAPDVLLVPVGAVVRTAWRIFPPLARAPRLVTRFGWQANRIGPERVISAVREASPAARSVTVYQSDRRHGTIDASVPVKRLPGAHPSHWWLVIER